MARKKKKYQNGGIDPPARESTRVNTVLPLTGDLLEPILSPEELREDFIPRIISEGIPFAKLTPVQRTGVRRTLEEDFGRKNLTDSKAQEILDDLFAHTKRQELDNLYEERIFSQKEYPRSIFEDAIQHVDPATKNTHLMKIPRAIAEDVKAAGRKTGVDPMLLMSLLTQESTLGQGTGATRALTPRDLASAWNIGVKSFEDWVVENAPKGVKLKETFHRYKLEEPLTPEQIRDLAPKYEKYVQSIPDKAPFEDVAEFIRDEGLQKYNPGDPDYPNKIKKVQASLSKNKRLTELLKAKGGKMEYPLGGILGGMAGNLIGKALGSVAKDVPKKGKEYFGPNAQEGGDGIGNLTEELIPLLENLQEILARGGVIEGVGAEVEGQEAFETPDGMTGIFEGPSHEQGGIDIEAPENTRIYSKRLKRDGKTMAQRKEERDKRTRKQLALYEADPADRINKQSLLRTLMTGIEEDVEDMQIQESAELEEFAAGGVTSDKAREILRHGSVRGNPLTDKQKRYFGWMAGKKAYGGNIKAEKLKRMYPHGGVHGDRELLPFEKTTHPLDPDESFKITDPLEPVSLLGDQGRLTARNTELGYLDAPDPMAQREAATPFDVGTAGNVLGILGPLATTVASRLTDEPNINRFQGIGRRAESTLDKAFGASASEKALTQDLNTLRERAQLNRNRSRSLATESALGVATTAGTQRADAAASQAHLNRLSQLLQVKSNLQEKVDSQIARGAQARDLMDKRDKDAFFTALSRNIANASEGLMNMGLMKSDRMQYIENLLSDVFK